MADDLWDSTIDQGLLQSIYHMQFGCSCDFYFGYGHDVIEENALNEKSCSEALRILITKADTEIGELEKDLKCLQLQLATENEECYELCCNLLKTRIKCFNLQCRSSKSNGSIISAELPMPGRPVHKAHEIMMNLLQRYIDKIDQENALRKKSFLQVLEILIKKANAEIDELEKDLEFILAELACAESEEFSDICCDVFREKIDFLDNSLKSFRSNDDTANRILLSSHRKPADSIREIVEPLLQKYLQDRELQRPSEISRLDSRSDASAHAAELLTKRREQRRFDSNITVMEEIKEIKDSSERSTSLYSSMELQEKKANNLETVEPVDKVSSSDSLNLKSGFFNDMKNSCDFDLEVNGNMEGRETHITPTEEIKNGNSSLDHGGKGMLKNANQPKNAIVMKYAYDAFERPIVYARNKSSELRLSASRLAKNKNCGEKQKPQTAHQVGISDSKVPMIKRIDSSNSQSKAEVDIRSLQQIETKSQQYVLKEPNEVREPQLESEKAIGVNDKKSHFNVGGKPNAAIGKRKFQAHTNSVQGLFRLSAEIELQAPISKAKRQLKTNIDDDSATLNQLIAWKPSNSVRVDHCVKEAKKGQEQCHNYKVDCKDSILPSKRKRKHASTLASSVENRVVAANVDGLDLSSNRTASECKALQLVCPSPLAVDTSAWAIVPVPSAKVDYAGLKLHELKVIAKQKKLKKFHKLKKSDLIELLKK